MQKRLPRLARIVRSYLRLFEPEIAKSIPYEERSRVKGKRLKQMQDEVQRIESRQSSRVGSTLTEVLVGMLILSIGVVSVASIFPLSILRSLRASQLTKGTDLAFNAGQMLAMQPHWITDPDGNGVANPGTFEYYVVDPVGAAPGNIDPSLRGCFGHVSGSAHPFTITAGVNTGGTNRYWTNCNTVAAADSLATLPDSWVDQYEGDVIPLSAFRAGTTAGYTRVDVAGLAASGLTAAAGIKYRAVISDGDGRSCTRVITSLVGDRIMWTEDIDVSGALNGTEDINGNRELDHNPLPGSPGGIAATFDPVKVRISSQDRRYTYLLTCRKNGSATQADVDVVVYFGREINGDVKENDESLYRTQFIAGSNQLSVTYNGTITPTVKRGGFVFDANNARWYRISNVMPSGSLPVPPATIVVTLETPAIASTPPGALGYVMLPRGVVDVYPIGSRP